MLRKAVPACACVAALAQLLGCADMTPEARSAASVFGAAAASSPNLTQGQRTMGAIMANEARRNDQNSAMGAVSGMRAIQADNGYVLIPGPFGVPEAGGFAYAQEYRYRVFLPDGTEVTNRVKSVTKHGWRWAPKYTVNLR